MQTPIDDHRLTTDDRPTEAYRRIIGRQDRDMMAIIRTCSEHAPSDQAPEHTDDAYRRIIDRQDRVITDLVCLCRRNGLGEQIETALHTLANIAMAIERADNPLHTLANIAMATGD